MKLILTFLSILVLYSNASFSKQHLCERTRLETLGFKDKEAAESWYPKKISITTNMEMKIATIYNEEVDLCIVANHDTSCLNVAVKVLRKGGTILFFGEPRANSKIKLDMSLIYSKEIRIITSYSATNKDFINAIKFIAKNEIDLKKFITHEFKIEDAVKGIKIAKEGRKRIKVIITANN